MAGLLDFLDLRGAGPGLLGGMNPMQRDLTNLGVGLLSASGPSRMPVGFGQAMAGGFRNAQAAEADAMDRALKERRSLSGGNIPAAVQLANEYEKAIAAGDARRAERLALFAKVYDKGVVPDGANGVSAMPGYAPTVAGIEGAKAGARQQAEKSVDLEMDPLIAAAKRLAELDASAEYSDSMTMPIVNQLLSMNEKGFDMPYSGVGLPLARLVPDASVQDKVGATELMLQARTDMAAPLAKELGVNPTDKDFQASLDRIFNINSTKESRRAQIQALVYRSQARKKERMSRGDANRLLDVFDESPPGDRIPLTQFDR